MFDDHEFALCLTHDVDRPYKTFQIPYYALKKRDPSHLKSLVNSDQPYWQFEEIMRLEKELGVRSSFYFLNEKCLFRDKGLSEWGKPKNWKLFTGRYDIASEAVVDIIQTLDEGGWEVGLHGSYDSYDEPERLHYEKETLEDIVGHNVIGGRQHYLNLKQPETWKHHREIGLLYDSSLGLSTDYGFQYGYQPIRPFNDEFVVFPLTLMECTLKNVSTNLERAKKECHRLLEEAQEQNAVMTILWHPRFFNPSEFRGYRELYVDLVTTAKEMAAWIGPCRDCYKLIVEDTDHVY